MGVKKLVTDGDIKESTAILPPDGTIIRVSQWRQQIAWIPTVLYGLFALWSPVFAAQKGSPLAGRIIGVLGFGFAAAVSARMALSGVMIEHEGIKARSAWWTSHWRWEEIERFELRARGELPRFRVHLRDGQVRGFLGFFARSPVQEARSKELFRALEQRLRAEQDAVRSPR